jgi:hypothetical protein
MVGKIYPLTSRVNSWCNKLKNLKQFPPKKSSNLFKNWEFHANKTSKTSQKHVFFGYPWICKKDPIKTEAHHPNLHVDDSQHHLRPGGTLNGGNLTISKLQIWLYVCIYICIDWIVLIVTLWELELHIINYIIRIVCVHYIIYRLIETHI